MCFLSCGMVGTQQHGSNVKYAETEFDISAKRRKNRKQLRRKNRKTLKRRRRKQRNRKQRKSKRRRGQKKTHKERSSYHSTSTFMGHFYTLCLVTRYNSHMTPRFVCCTVLATHMSSSSTTYKWVWTCTKWKSLHIFHANFKSKRRRGQKKTHKERKEKFKSKIKRQG
jgi:hypothetical protein